jgi:hypothetical protein
MIKTFALIAVIYGSDGHGHAYVVDDGMSAIDCLTAMESVVAARGWTDSQYGFTGLADGDSIQCEVTI